MPGPSGKIARVADIGLIGLFVIALWLPLLKTLIEPRPTVSAQEGRALAAPPLLRAKPSDLAQFPARFEKYFNDCFGYRTELIRWLAEARLKGLKTSTSTHVILGRKGWLYHGDDSYVTNYRNTRPFRPDELEKWRKVLEERRDWLAQRGIHYLLIIAPEKPTIYPEYLPWGLNQVRPESRLDQFLTHLRAQSTLDIVDLRTALREAKATEQIYYKKDTHWNWRGAFAGYQRITQALTSWFPKVRPLPRAAFTPVAVVKKNCNLARMLGPVVPWDEPDWILDLGSSRQARVAPVAAGTSQPFHHSDPLVARENPHPGLPRAVMFHDSFTYHMLDYLAENFSRIAFFMQDFPQFDLKCIERERPQVVLQEMVEWKLMLDIPDNPPGLSNELVVKH